MYSENRRTEPTGERDSQNGRYDRDESAQIGFCASGSLSCMDHCAFACKLAQEGIHDQTHLSSFLLLGRVFASETSGTICVDFPAQIRSHGLGEREMNYWMGSERPGGGCLPRKSLRG